MVSAGRTTRLLLTAVLCVGPMLAACDGVARDGSASDSATGQRDRHRTPPADSSADPTGPRPSSSGGQRPQGPVSRGWRVSRVIDGDTVEVARGGRTVDVRLIGIDTPETVHPSEPIECFGPEASDYAQRALLGQPVMLEFDRSQGRRDYYGRTLAYIWRTGPTRRLFNLGAVRRGYALEYTYDRAYSWQQAFRRAEHLARQERLGVWQCRHPGS